MILAHHLILSAYGFWLPNDPRGSWSTFVGAWDLYRAGGQATKVETTDSVAHAPHDRYARLRTKAALKRPPVRFTGEQASAVGKGFARASAEGDYLVWACAILPDHMHLIIGPTARPVGQVSGHLKTRATQAIRAAGLWPEDPLQSPWARKAWSVFIDTKPWVKSAIAYVERNPEKEGKRRQRWSFVKPYE